MKVHRQFKLVSDVQSIPKGAVVDELNRNEIRSTVLSTLSSLQKTNPNQNYVVCEYLDKQIILKIGRDIIPYSLGIGSKVKMR